MNISELKEMARQYWQVPNHNISSLLQAILSLPDDDGEELVRLAEEVLKVEGWQRSGSLHLASAVLSRYRKREEPKPRYEISGWVPIFEGLIFGTVEPSKEAAQRQSRMQAYENGKSGGGIRILKPITCIFVSGIEGVYPDQPEEGK